MLERSSAASTFDVARPGFSVTRITNLMREEIQRLGLDLRGITVLTEAATGAYASTAVLAAMAGARWVYAYARDNRYGSCGELARQTLGLARAAGVEDRVEIVTKSPASLAFEVQIVTNSGNLRPLDAELIERLPQGAVIALMYPARDLRPADLDLAACRARRVPVVAVSSVNADGDMAPYLGAMAVRQLHDAGFSVHGCRLAVVCDVTGASHLPRCLEGMGAEVAVAPTVGALPSGPFDAVLIATGRNDPSDDLQLAAAELVRRVGCVPVVQLWGQVDRGVLDGLRVPFWPLQAPAAGQIAISLLAIGPETVVRRQAVGLLAAGVVFRGGVAAAIPGSPADILRLSFGDVEGSA